MTGRTIGGVGAMDDGGAAAADLLAFAARLRRRHVGGAALGASLRALLSVAAPAIVIAWLLPAARLHVAAAVTALALVATALAAWRARGVAEAMLLQLAEPADVAEPKALAEFGDELATWLEQRHVRSPMRSWLLRDTHARLPRLQLQAIEQVGRPRLGRFLWLLPVVLLLLLAWLLVEWLAPPWDGVLGGRPTQQVPGTGDGDSGSGGQGGGGGQRPEPEPGPPKPQPDRPTVPLAPEQPEPTPEPSTTPAPLLDLPEQQRFVLPEFVGDGPTRRARMHAAELGEGGAGATPPPARGAGDPQAPVPPPAAEQFARAAEQALRARHVPATEQPIVRRYFDALREAAK